MMVVLPFCHWFVGTSVVLLRQTGRYHTRHESLNGNDNLENDMDAFSLLATNHYRLKDTNRSRHYKLQESILSSGHRVHVKSLYDIMGSSNVVETEH